MNTKISHSFFICHIKLLRFGLFIAYFYFVFPFFVITLEKNNQYLSCKNTSILAMLNDSSWTWWNGNWMSLNLNLRFCKTRAHPHSQTKLDEKRNKEDKIRILIKIFTNINYLRASNMKLLKLVALFFSIDWCRAFFSRVNCLNWHKVGNTEKKIYI